MPRKKTRNGLTLFETMVAIGIFAVVTGAIMAVFMFATNSWKISESRTRTQQEVRRAMQTITKELSSSSSAHVSILNDSDELAYTGTKIRFQLPLYSQHRVQLDASGQILWGIGSNQGYWVSYQVVKPTGSNAGQLIRKILDASYTEVQGNTSILANDIESITFLALPNNTYSPRAVNILLKGAHADIAAETILKSRVWFRN